jgi:hypothetical protein
LKSAKFGESWPPFTPASFVFLSKKVKIKIFCTNTILPVVLYGCGIKCLSQSEEHGFGISENRVLRKLFRPKGEEEEEEARGRRK